MRKKHKILEIFLVFILFYRNFAPDYALLCIYHINS